MCVFVGDDLQDKTMDPKQTAADYQACLRDFERKPLQPFMDGKRRRNFLLCKNLMDFMVGIGEIENFK